MKMAERKPEKIVSKRIVHRECEVTDEDIRHAQPVKMPQVTPEQHRARTRQRAANEQDSTADDVE
jgi:hypothetical protein